MPDAAEDEKTIRELHEGFMTANLTAETAFLRQHMAPGPDALLWNNLNGSNYVGVDHICELWDFLRDLTGGQEATITHRDDAIFVRGDVAWVTYMLHLRADFGVMGKVDQQARSTEIWERQDGDWKMVHFHCSNHVPEQMGGY